MRLESQQTLGEHPFFGELRRRGILDNTVVVIPSDHGEQFCEHGLDDHANFTVACETANAFQYQVTYSATS